MHLQLPELPSASSLEVTRFRAKDSVTGEEYDDVFYNETSEDEGRSICQEEGDNFTPSLAVIETARRLRETEGGPSMASAISAFVDIAEYFGQEIYHMEAPVGSLDPIEVPSAEKLSQLSTDWLEELNAVLTKEQRDPCPTGPKWLLVCMKKTTCLLERAAEATPHIITPGRMATYLEVAKEVEDHYEEFAVQAFMGLPYMPDLCDGEESSLEFPAQLCCNSKPRARQPMSKASATAGLCPRSSTRSGHLPGRCKLSKTTHVCTCWKRPFSPTPGRRHVSTVMFPGFEFVRSAVRHRATKVAVEDRKGFVSCVMFSGLFLGVISLLSP